MSGYFSKPKLLGESVKIQLYLSNYATKSDLKKATLVDTSDFAKKADLASLKSDIDELDIDKLKTITVCLSKLSNVVNNDVTKFNTTDTNEFF